MDYDCLTLLKIRVNDRHIYALDYMIESSLVSE